MEVHDIVQERGSNARKRNAKKSQWLSEEAFKIAEKGREAKGKREKERYTHVNGEFQRIAFLSFIVPIFP